MRALVLGLCLGLVGCGLDVIEVPVTAESRVSKGNVLDGLVGDLGFDGLSAFDISQSAAFQNQGVKRSQIDSLTLQSLSLTIFDTPDEQDFGFVDEIRFFAEAEGLPRVLIATGGPFEAGARQVFMETISEELADYAAAPQMSITTEVTGRRPRNDTNLRADVVLEVDVNLCL